MKAKSFLFCLVLLAAFFGVTKIVFAKESQKEMAASNIELPYVIEVVDPSGDKEEIKGLSQKTDPFLIAEELGASPFTEDRISVFPEIKMGIGSKITLRRAPTIYVKDGKKNHEFRSWEETVGGLLRERNIEIGKDDRINFAVDNSLEPNMSIVIIRVAITNVDVKEVIDYKTIKKNDNTLDEGKTRIETTGVNGVRTKTYLVRREDGEEISRTLTNNVVTTEPVDEVLIIGTKPVITVRCKFNDTVLAAGMKYGVKPNDLCIRMMKESNGNPNSDGGRYKGLFQYEEGFWASVSTKAGYAGASIWDANAQIYTTAWAWSHGLRGRWPSD